MIKFTTGQLGAGMSFNCGPSEFNGAAPLVAPLGTVSGPGVRTLKSVNLFSHLVHSSGCWFVVGGDRCVTLRMTRGHFANAQARSL